MTRSEYHSTRRKKFAELRKNRIDSAYEFYCSLSAEDKLISEFTFAKKLCKHMCISMGVARYATADLIDEYHIEFCKNKSSNPSCRIFWTKSFCESKSSNLEIDNRAQ